MAVSDKYIIDVRTKGAKKAGKDLKGVGAGAASMAKSVGIAAVAYVGARGLISAIQGSIDAFAKQELAQKKLETALGRTSHALLDQARALQQVSMFGDEDIIMMQSMLAAFVDGEDEIKKLTVATLDLASGMGIDLKNAGDLIAKTIGSSTNALSRYGIQVDGAVGSSERLETLTGNIANLFGGQAKAQSETMMGSMEQMKNAIGDTAEAFGSLLSPAIIGSSRMLKGMAESLSSAIEDFDRFMNGGSNVAGILGELEYQTILFNQELESLGENEAALLDLGNEIVKQRDEEQNAVGLSTEILAQYELQLKLINDRLVELKSNQEEEVIAVTDSSSAYQDYIIGLREANTQATQQEKWIKRYIELFPEQAKALGLVKKATKDLDKEEQLHYARSLGGLRSMIKSKIQAYSAEMFAGLLSKEIASKGIYGLLTASAGAIAAGALFESVVPQFAHGGVVGGRSHSQGGTMINAEQGEFVMSRNAVSSIGVENLNRMNQGASGGGSGITVNISGGMISPDFVENELAESVREAIRRGADFGIS